MLVSAELIQELRPHGVQDTVAGHYILRRRSFIYFDEGPSPPRFLPNSVMAAVNNLRTVRDHARKIARLPRRRTCARPSERQLKA
jgi:hypothetical protein